MRLERRSLSSGVESGCMTFENLTTEARRHEWIYLRGSILVGGDVFSIFISTHLDLMICYLRSGLRGRGLVVFVACRRD